MLDFCEATVDSGAWPQQPSFNRNLVPNLIVCQSSTCAAGESARCQSIPFTTNIQTILKETHFIKTSI